MTCAGSMLLNDARSTAKADSVLLIPVAWSGSIPIGTSRSCIPESIDIIDCSLTPIAVAVVAPHACTSPAASPKTVLNLPIVSCICEPARIAMASGAPTAAVIMPPIFINCWPWPRSLLDSFRKSDCTALAPAAMRLRMPISTNALPALMFFAIG